MTVGYKEREIVSLKKSSSYFSLKDHKFSMTQEGLVVVHADNIWMRDVTFRVRESGRQQVLRERRKNVHAFVDGMYMGHDFELPEDFAGYLIGMGYREAYYNPYKTSTFVDYYTREPLTNARNVMLVNKRIFYRI